MSDPAAVWLKATLLSQPLDISQNGNFFNATYFSENACIQLYRLEKVGSKALLEARLEKVGLKALLDSSQPVVPKCLEILRFGRFPKPLQKLMVWR